MSWLDDELGKIFQDGVELEGLGGLNFVSAFQLTAATDSEGVMRYDITLKNPAVSSVTHVRDQSASGNYAASTEFINCTITGSITLTGTATFRGCKCAGAFNITATAIEVDRSSAKAIQNAGTTVSVLPDSLDADGSMFYGSGETGALNISAGTTQVNSGIEVTAEYTNITLSGTGAIQNGGRSVIYVNGLLDISAAMVGAIFDATSGAGGNAAADVGGTAGGANNGTVQGGPGNMGGTVGQAGVAGIGVLPAAPTTLRHGAGNGGAAGTSGNGVAAGVAGGVGGTFTGIRSRFASSQQPFVGPGLQASTTPAMHNGGGAGRAGASGGGNNVAVKGGGGGGSGSGGGTIVIRARGIKLGTATPAGVIRTVPGTGGNGGNGAADALATGGGSGAGGGGGGNIVIFYDWLIGAAPAAGAVVTSAGAAGGNGGNGNGSGASTGGDGGGGGDGGMIQMFNRIKGTRTTTLGSAGTAGTAHSGATGGAGGGGGACAAAFPALPG